MSKQWHELSKKIRENLGWIYSFQTDDIDLILRSWLEKKAKELISIGYNPIKTESGPATIRRVLGLEREPENPGTPEEREVESWMKEPKQEKWCEHIECLNPNVCGMKSDLTIVAPYWKQCPICGTPRLVEKSLAQLLFEAWKEHTGHDENWGDSKTMMEGFEAEADCARRYFEGGGK